QRESAADPLLAIGGTSRATARRLRRSRLHGWIPDRARPQPSRGARVGERTGRTTGGARAEDVGLGSRASGQAGDVGRRGGPRGAVERKGTPPFRRGHRTPVSHVPPLAPSHEGGRALFGGRISH